MNNAAAWFTQNARNEGAAAADGGFGINDCPYTTHALCVAWVEGWLAEVEFWSTQR